MVVIETACVTTALQHWCKEQSLSIPEPVLGVHHLPLSAVQLSAFAAQWPGLAYEVRKPNLDDLFTHLSGGVAEGHT